MEAAERDAVAKLLATLDLTEQTLAQLKAAAESAVEVKSSA
jgi:hypothetical protein